MEEKKKKDLGELFADVFRTKCNFCEKTIEKNDSITFYRKDYCNEICKNKKFSIK